VVPNETISVTCGFPRERAGLVETGHGDLADLLQHGATLQQKSTPRTGRQAGGNGSRCRNNQSTGQPIRRIASPLYIHSFHKPPMSNGGTVSY
jgi:hypothetical protein